MMSVRRLPSSVGPCSLSSVLVAPVTTARGVRRSCETELRSAFRSCSVSARNVARRASSARVVRSMAEPMRPANVSRRRRSSRSLALPILPARDGKQPQHPDAAARAVEGDEERGRRRQEVRAGPRGPLTAPGPHGRVLGPLGRAHELFVGEHRLDGVFVARHRHEDRDVRVEDVAHVTGRRLQQGLARISETDLATERVEARRAALTAARRVGLIPNAFGQVADHEGHHEHHGEGDDMAEVGDGKAEEGRNEEELERQNAEHRGEQRRAVPESRRHDDHPQQVDHHDVGHLLLPEHEPRDEPRRRDHDRRRGIAERGPRPFVHVPIVA